MNIWERLNEASLPDKKEFCSSLNMEALQMLIISTEKGVWKYFRVKK